MRKLTWLGAGVLIMAPWLTAPAVTRYVSLDGGDDAAGGYTNWPGAATAIQAAVDACNHGDVILVSNGTYSVSANDWVVRIEKSLTMRGVYNREATIINGSNTRYCLFIYQTTNLPIEISGFTFTEGRNISTVRGGGGIRVESSGEVRIADCIISNNTATAYYGGGVYHGRRPGTLILTNCLIIGNNSASGGGGIYNDNIVGMLKMYDCQVLTNTAATTGGGIFAQGPIHLDNCVVSSNSTSSTGGGFHNWNKLTVINRSIFEGNQAAGSGGGIFIRDTAVQSFISNCIIRGNTSSYSSGAVAAGIKFDGAGRLVGCLIEGNTASASYGSGLALAAKAVECENLTIVSNSASSRGGGLTVVSGSLATIRNSIIYDNNATIAGSSNIYILGAGLTFSNCCTAPLSAVVGDGNIDFEPLFVDPASGRYQLQSHSPCVNTGESQLWMADALDLDGHTRVDRFSRKVDMGCYEYVYRGSIFQLR